MSPHQARRRALLGTAALAPLVHLGIASAQSANDYRALVCIDLFGGNDLFNTVYPTDPESIARLREDRGAFLREVGLPIAAGGGVTRPMAFNPMLSFVRDAYNLGQASVLANVGTLFEPVTREAIERGTARLPRNLGSHPDAVHYTHLGTASSSNGRGWGGQLADRFADQAGELSALSCIATSAVTAWQAGEHVASYVPSNQTFASVMNETAMPIAAMAMATAASDHPMRQDLVRIIKESNALITELNEAQRQIEASVGPLPADLTNNALARQLRTVAIAMGASARLGLKRQTFYVTTGGFDLHGGPSFLDEHERLLKNLDDALRYVHMLYARLDGKNFTNQVTTFCMTEFGRNSVVNSLKGTDHGWGSHMLVLGGSVAGGRIYGRVPTVGFRGGENPEFAPASLVAPGTLIPTTAMDQVGHEFGRWFGVGMADLATIFPNAKNFSQAPAFMRT